MSDILDLRFQRAVQRLHRCGPRAVYELLAEIGAARLCRTDIEQRVERFVRLSPETCAAVGADRFAPVPLREVPR